MGKLTGHGVEDPAEARSCWLSQTKVKESGFYPKCNVCRGREQSTGFCFWLQTTLAAVAGQQTEGARVVSEAAVAA